MGWDGAGTFSRIHDWTADRDAAIPITASRVDADSDDFVSGIHASIQKNGENAATANLPMGGFRHTGVGAASARTHYGRVAEIQDSGYNYAADSGAANALEIAPTPAITAYAAGQIFWVKAAATNTSETVTLAVSGLTAETVLLADGATAPAVGAIVSGKIHGFLRDETNDKFILLNPAIVPAARGVNAQSGTTYTIVAGDRYKLVTFTNGSAIAVTLPQATTAGFGAGFVFLARCLSGSTGSATITPTTSTIDGAATLVLAPGQSAIIVSDGTNYLTVGRVSVQADAANTFTAANTFQATVTWSKGGDVASADPLVLGSDGNYFDVTGTTGFAAIGTKGVGTVVKLHFDGALTITHHATDLVLPGGASITTAAGDEAEFVEYAAGDWRCTNYVKASGAPVLVADKAAMEAASSNAAAVTPARMNDHLGVAKTLGHVTYSGGVPTLQAGSLNVSSIDDDGTGILGVNLTTAHANDDYIMLPTGGQAVPDGAVTEDTDLRMAGSFQIKHTSSAGGATDIVNMSFATFGAQ